MIPITNVRRLSKKSLMSMKTEILTNSYCFKLLQSQNIPYVTHFSNISDKKLILHTIQTSNTKLFLEIDLNIRIVATITGKT